MSLLQHSDCEYLNFHKITGNLTPFSFYKHITNSRNQPDLVSISILSEIIYWYRKNSDKNKTKFNDDSWRTSYSHFETKFNYNREKIRRAFVRLEEKGLVKRDFRTVYIYGKAYNNVLFVLLNLEKINKILSTDKLDKKIFSSDNKIVDPSPQLCGDYIYKENKEYKKNRSINNNSNKKFDHFLPITEDIYYKIISKSSKKYSKEFITKLITKLKENYSDNFFKNEENFVTYMVKSLDNEFHKEDISSKENIKANLIKKHESGVEEGVPTKIKLKFLEKLPEEESLLVLENFEFLVTQNNRLLVNELDSNISFGDKYFNLLKDILSSEEEFKKLILDHDTNKPLKKETIWRKTLNILLNMFGYKVYKTWFFDLDPEIIEQDYIKIKAKTRFFRDWIKNNYLIKIENAVKIINPEIKEVIIDI